MNSKSKAKSGSKFHLPSSGFESWKPLLAKPELHWKEGRSALSLAWHWETANGFPPKIDEVLKANELDLEIVFAFPEYQVELDTPDYPSQNDLFVLARDSNQLYALSIEGKVDENFDYPVGEWVVSKTEARKDRFKWLLKKLQLQGDEISHAKQRYQLFHRTASAILMAEKLHTDTAIMIVHSFGSTNDHFEDYEAFVKLFGILNPKRDQLYQVPKLISRIKLYLGWVSDEAITFPSLAAEPLKGNPEQRFWTSSKNFESKANSYTASYSAFIDYFKNLPGKIEAEHLTIGIHFTYGWMPTVFNFGKDNTQTAVLAILNDAKGGKRPTPQEMEILKKYLNNSMVGTSKLLHFINPDVFAIWDSKVYKYLYQQAAHEYRIGNCATYLAYLKWLDGITSRQEFAGVLQKVNSALGYPVSRFRAAELIMFTSR
jgi:hypothetical protein